MADLTVTASAVVPGAGASLRNGDIAGVAIVAGQPYYIDTNNVAQLCDTSTAIKAAAAAIAINSAAAGQPLSGIVSGPLTMGPILTASVGYAVADTAGGIRPLADNATGDFITSLGVAKSATVLDVNIRATGAQK